jgi:HD-GYP domain-containing protein (c-di-GMP phosphodiesterase class II)
MTPCVEHVNLSEVVAALSHALDLTEGQPEGHAGRTCLLGVRLAEDLGMHRDDVAALYHALLLKDSGCSSSAVRLSSLFGTDDIALKREGKLVDWTRPAEALPYMARGLQIRNPFTRARRTLQVALDLARNDGLVDARCERGARIVRELGFPPASAEAVRAIDEHWDGRGKPRGLRGEEIPPLARVACLAQTAEVFVTAAGRDAARATVRRRRGRWFDPAVADAFLAIGDGDPLWEHLLEAHHPGVVAARERTPLVVPTDDVRIDRIADAFAQVIDAKSSFTARHSRSVGEYAVAIGRAMGDDATALRDLRRAALLHDIGKLGVSTAILEKPGALTARERQEVMLHPMYTVQILSRVRVFGDIACSAGAHHERLDGTGYHQGLRGDEIDRMARILAVADVHDALTADRPYRAGMPVARALQVMRREAGTGLCPEVLDAHEAVLAGGGGLVRA